MGLLLEPTEHIVRAIPLDRCHPLRVVDVVVVQNTELRREGRDRPYDHCRLEFEEASVPVAAKRRVPVEADDAAIVRVEVLPAAPPGLLEASRAATRQT